MHDLSLVLYVIPPDFRKMLEKPLTFQKNNFYFVELCGKI